MRTWLVAIFLALIAISPIVYMTYNWTSIFGQQKDFEPLAVIDFQPELTNILLEEGAEINVFTCSVIDGYRFSLNLEGGYKIIAHLPVATKAEAVQVVVDTLNNSRFPIAVLLRDAGGYWVVNLYLTHMGERVSMVELLRRKELLLD